MILAEIEIKIKKMLRIPVVGFWIVVILLIVSCETRDNIDVDQIEYEMDFQRIDLKMYNCAQALAQNPQLDYWQAYQTYLVEDRDFYWQLLGIKDANQIQTYTMGHRDSLIAKNMGSLLADSSMYQLLDTIQTQFPDSFPFKARLTPPIKRLIYHFGKDSLDIPAFRTFANGYIPNGGLQMVDQLQVLPEFMGLGLHFFMGADFPFYPANIPAYLRKQFAPTYLETVVVSALAEGMVAPLPIDKQPTLLDRIVRTGIKQYFMDQLLPDTADSLKLYYTTQQIDWANEYEAFLYRDIISHLYEIDFVVHRDYLGQKPYSTHISQEAAPRIGQFIGWKIVKQFMKRNPDVNLADLCIRQDYDTIFKEAKYRPD